MISARALRPTPALRTPPALSPTPALPVTATARQPRLLLVDDDPKLREVVGYALEREGYAVTQARNGAEALDLLEATGSSSADFDLLVVDVSMPEIDGFDLVRRLRLRDADTPVLFLSARSDEIDRILGLELGGDDYVTKPFSTRELATRVKVLLRRVGRQRRLDPASASHSGTQSPAASADAEASTDLGEELRAGPLRLLPEAHRSFWAGREVALTATEFRLLEVLIRRPGRVYSRDELGRQAYPDARHVSGRTLDSHVRRIRAKFRVHEVDPIETVHGVGYRLREWTG
ncbi:DNA-binding response regulator [Plesiocystis pacifica SIR-1]|uniref:DNA-binding response regulator n=1 Tax=Plesiocystis pacifica SIR-1 TaxID=391625 RepID=A6G8V6_9BACT|nr:response regulator transcription factor [Plesiocystis pacifica]EDM77642.1 DNA-binding response regulator [Plesiocystis pacifica SIR-1]